jgi:hypothetical protein
MPEFWNTLRDIDERHRLLARGEREGIQSHTTSAPPPAITWLGLMSGPPGLIVTSEPDAS